MSINGFATREHSCTPPKLYLFNNPEAEARFMRDPLRAVHEAREHYFNLASKHRSTY